MSTYILFSNKQAIGRDLHSNSEIIIKENSKFGLKKIENGIF